MTSVFRRDDAPRSSTPGGGLDRGASRRARHAEFLDVVELLRAVPPVEPRARVRRRRCARELMAEAETAAASPADDDRDSRSRPAPARRDRRLAAAIGGSPSRRRHLDGRGRPERAARRHALPAQARHRGRRDQRRPDSDAPRAPRCSPTPAAGSPRSPSSAARAADDRRRAVAPPSTTSRAGHRAADLLLADYAETGDRSGDRAARLHRRSMDTLQSLESSVPRPPATSCCAAVEVLSEIDARARGPARAAAARDRPGPAGAALLGRHRPQVRGGPGCDRGRWRPGARAAARPGTPESSGDQRSPTDGLVGASDGGTDGSGGGSEPAPADRSPT